MQSLRFSVLVFALWACGGRTASDATLNGAATGGSPGTIASGGAAGFPNDGCAEVTFRAASTPGYDARWCLGYPSDRRNAFDVANDSGSLSLAGEWLQCNAEDCSWRQPEPPSGLAPEYAIESPDVTWSGVYHTFSTCGEAANACSLPHCAGSGRYLVTLCGYVNPNPAWVGGCSEANGQTPVYCGAAEFEYPAVTPVVVTLRPPLD